VSADKSALSVNEVVTSDARGTIGSATVEDVLTLPDTVAEAIGEPPDISMFAIAVST
jgi:hypothetical protein